VAIKKAAPEGLSALGAAGVKQAAQLSNTATTPNPATSTTSTSASPPASLAQQVAHEHALAKEHAETALTHAIRCGELLLAGKRRVGHGAWLPWLEQCGVNERQAQRYVKLYKERDLLKLKSDACVGFTVRAALKAIAKPKPRTSEAPRQQPEHQLAAAVAKLKLLQPKIPPAGHLQVWRFDQREVWVLPSTIVGYFHFALIATLADGSAQVDATSRPMRGDALLKHLVSLFSISDSSAARPCPRLERNPWLEAADAA
jgi:hypothetical protein